MEFTVKRSDLLQEIGLTQGVVERKSTIPILSNLLCEVQNDQLAVTASDLELCIRTSCNVRTKKEGAGTIPARKLLDLVRLLPDEEIRVKLLDNNWLQVVASQKTYSAFSLPSQSSLLQWRTTHTSSRPVFLGSSNRPKLLQPVVETRTGSTEALGSKAVARSPELERRMLHLLQH